MLIPQVSLRPMIQSKRTFSLILLISLISFFQVHGQALDDKNYPSVNIVSPTATSLGKFVDFPANLHTGVPEVNIPIYTVQEGPLQLPISLSYHASGLKVMEPAGWVGTGWALNAGGVVSRNVKGLPDESANPDGHSFYSSNGFSNYFYYVDDASGLLIDYQKFSEGRKDGEPDVFTFNFGSYGGKFYFREDLTPILIPEGDIKIETIVKPGPNTGGNDYIQGFKITTPDGVKYHFGVTDQAGDTDPIEKSRLYTIADLTYPDVISSWYLYKIESADNKFAINITYRPEEYGYYTLSSKNEASGHGTISHQKVIIYGVAMQQIQFSNGTVDFIANNWRQDLSNKFITPYDGENNWTNNAKSLDAITVDSNQGTHCISYNFFYTYFFDESMRELPYVISQYGGSAAYSTDRKRLKLNSFQKISCDNTISEPPHQFYYYDEGIVPRRLSFAQDHWGFYNGAVSNTTLLPPISTGGQSYWNPNGDDRNPKWPEMRAGALRMIQYPTGGGTEYVYEANRTKTTSNCSFERTSNVIASAFAGMDGNDGFGTPQTLVLQNPTTLYYRVTISGQASGSLYIDNTAIASVSNSNSNVENYIYLNAGTHTLQAYASPDPNYGSGNGVLAYLYEVASVCDPPKEKMVGGLRIKEITKFTGSQSPKLSRTYEYGNSNLYGIPTYVFKYKHPYIKGLDVYPTEYGCIPHNGTSSSYPVRFGTSPVSVHPMQSVQGYHIGYREVKEIAPDGGYTVNEYKGNVVLPGGWSAMEDVAVTKINVNTCTSNDPIYPQAPLPYDFGRGSLMIKKVFDGSSKKLKEIINSEQYLESPIGGFGLTIGHLPYGNGHNIPLPIHYELKSAKLLWSKQKEVTFDAANNSIAQETVTNFGSNYHRMPTSETRTSQNGVSEAKYRYVSDITECNTGCQSCVDAYLAAASALYDQYLAKENTCTAGGCDNSSFLGWQYLGYSPCSATFRCRWASLTDYNYRLNQVRVTYTNCIRNCKQNNNCIANGLSTSTNEGVKTLFAMEQANQLSKIESMLWKNNIFQSSAFLDYRPKGGDFSKIYLRDVYTTEIATPVSSFVPAYISSGVIVRDTKYNPQSQQSFIYSEGQPVEIKESNGVSTSYIWGFNNTVPIVKSVGSTYSNLSTAYNNSGINLRNDPLLSGAQVSTYTYNDPIVGIATVTDANGNLLTYEYDKLGRLIRIKDHTGKVLEQYEYSYRID
jgi:YD repeat-containing protein